MIRKTFRTLYEKKSLKIPKG